MPEEIATKRCPYCAEMVRAEAIKCRWCGSAFAPTALHRTWYRVTEGKRIAGVCAGLAEEFGISVTLIRLAFVLGTLAGGPGLIVYVVLWIVMPLRPAWRRVVAADRGSLPDALP